MTTPKLDTELLRELQNQDLPRIKNEQVEVPSGDYQSTWLGGYRLVTLNGGDRTASVAFRFRSLPVANDSPEGEANPWAGLLSEQGHAKARVGFLVSSETEGQGEIRVSVMLAPPHNDPDSTIPVDSLRQLLASRFRDSQIVPESEEMTRENGVRGSDGRPRWRERDALNKLVALAPSISCITGIPAKSPVCPNPLDVVADGMALGGPWWYLVLASPVSASDPRLTWEAVHAALWKVASSEGSLPQEVLSNLAGRLCSPLRDWWAVSVYCGAVDERSRRQLAASLCSSFGYAGEDELVLDPLQSSPTMRGGVGDAARALDHLILKSGQRVKASNLGGLDVSEWEGLLDLRQTPRLHTALTTQELSRWFRLPKFDRPGFSRTPLQIPQSYPTQPVASDSQAWKLGSTSDAVKRNVLLSPKDLLLGTVVVGHIGSGKTNDLINLASAVCSGKGAKSLRRGGKPGTTSPSLLIIDLAGEGFSRLVSSIPDLRIYRAGGARSNLRLNPLQSPSGVEDYQEILARYLRGAFPVEGVGLLAVDALVKEAFSRNGEISLPHLYLSAGIIPDVFQHEEKVRQDIFGIIEARVSSLFNGANFKIFNTAHSSPSIEDLWRDTDGAPRHTLIELGDYQGSSIHDLAFLLALILAPLTALARRQGPTRDLRLLLIIDEAHRMLPSIDSVRSDPATGMAVANLRLLLSQMMVELRKFGVGIVFADQHPERLGTDIIGNASTLVVHRVENASERESLANHLGLQKDFEDAIGHLRLGEAIVKLPNENSPITVAMHPPEKELGDETTPTYRRSDEDSFTPPRPFGILCVKCPSPCEYIVDATKILLGPPPPLNQGNASSQSMRFVDWARHAWSKSPSKDTKPFGSNLMKELLEAASKGGTVKRSLKEGRAQCAFTLFNAELQGKRVIPRRRV